MLELRGNEELNSDVIEPPLPDGEFRCRIKTTKI